MRKVVLGLSGGVDSTLSAGLLLEKGYEVIGVHLWQGDDRGLEKAENAARELGIRFVCVDIRGHMKSMVHDYFVSEYLKGRTPSPCVLCNAEVKLPQLYLQAELLGAEHVATGHYAHVDRAGGRYRLLRSKGGKDQSYMLSRLTQNQLSGLILPLGDLTKEQVRALAAERGLSAAEEKDSMELCFVPDNDHAAFLRSCVGELKKGPFVDPEGNELGSHDGIGAYTVGQRKGLGAFGKPMYVLGVDASSASVTVGPPELLYKNEFHVDGLHMVSRQMLFDGDRAQVKVRHSKNETEVILHPRADSCLVECVEPVRAPAPGQAAVFYSGDEVLASGWIR